METVATIMGYFVIITICASVLLYLFEKLSASLLHLIQSIMSPTVREARRSVGYSIMKSSHWFSENKECEMLLKIIGEHIHSHYEGYFDSHSVREEWRSKIK